MKDLINKLSKTKDKDFRVSGNYKKRIIIARFYNGKILVEKIRTNTLTDSQFYECLKYNKEEMISFLAEYDYNIPPRRRKLKKTKKKQLKMYVPQITYDRYLIEYNTYWTQNIANRFYYKAIRLLNARVEGDSLIIPSKMNY